MATLTAEQVEEVRHDVGALLTGLGIHTNMRKPAWRAAVEAIDSFLEANTVTVNNQFPEPFKSGASPKEKAMVVAYTALKRFNVI